MWLTQWLWWIAGVVNGLFDGGGDLMGLLVGLVAFSVVVVA